MPWCLVRDGPARFLSLSEDITNQKEAEEERERLLNQVREALAATESSRRLLDTVLERVPVGIVVVDNEGKLVLMNGTGRLISGVPPDQAVPVKDQNAQYALRDTRSGRPLDPEETPIARVVSGEIVPFFDYIFRRLGEIDDVWVEGSAVPLLDEEGTVTGGVAVFQDVTAQRTLDRQKIEFLSAIAHDLRTPLTSIRGRAQLVQRGIASGRMDTARILDEVDRIDAATARMTGLVTDLLDVAHAELGRPVSLRLAVTDLVALVRAAADDHATVSHRHAIVVESEEEKLLGWWDEGRLARVLVNLLSNAVKYSPEGGTITLRVRRDDTTAEPAAILSVSDPGIGIPAGKIDAMFERFSRGANITGNMTGAGIGLAVVREIVSQHGGTISVESREGHGSTFIIRLPLSTR